MDQVNKKIDLFKNETKELYCDIEKIELVDEYVDRKKYSVTYTLTLESSYRNFSKTFTILKSFPRFLTEDMDNDKTEVIEELLKSIILVKAVNDGNF